MMILAIDIGGKTRNGLCLMSKDTREIIKYSYIPYNNEKTPLEHRRRVIKEIEDIIRGLEDNIEAIVFEKINLFRGGNVSQLNNITSLCKLQTHIIDRFSESIPLYEIPVRSWKARVLGSAKATKDNAIQEVEQLYPDVNIKIPKYKAKDPDAFEYNHDLADAIMIARAACLYEDLTPSKYKVNFK